METTNSEQSAEGEAIVHFCFTHNPLSFHPLPPLSSLNPHAHDYAFLDPFPSPNSHPVHLLRVERGCGWGTRLLSFKAIAFCVITGSPQGRHV